MNLEVDGQQWIWNNELNQLVEGLLKQQAREQEERINLIECEVMNKYIIIHGIKEETQETEPSPVKKVTDVIQSLGIPKKDYEYSKNQKTNI
ncbi:hypothetical protein ILUMI_26105 [Ignelater luminosus]|uniref:Uncharacterized protein n=1 Tax=Ignelater luminosus TaxID=2038154 RepID=A0A8K0C6A1_IGNLU|nr:hypothetical protein ILUMI_26105 [Ignelater luminosus]